MTNPNTSPNNPPTNCEVCQAPLKHLTGVSKKNGKPYDFYSCSAYPNCNYTWRPPSKESLRHEEVMKALRELWLKIDKMEKEFSAFTLIFSKDKDK